MGHRGRPRIRGVLVSEPRFASIARGRGSRLEGDRRRHDPCPLPGQGRTGSAHRGEHAGGVVVRRTGSVLRGGGGALREGPVIRPRGPGRLRRRSARPVRPAPGLRVPRAGAIQLDAGATWLRGGRPGAARHRDGCLVCGRGIDRTPKGYGPLDGLPGRSRFAGAALALCERRETKSFQAPFNRSISSYDIRTMKHRAAAALDRRIPTDADYRYHLTLRTELRRFNQWSEPQAAAHGVTAAQHQLMLAVRGHPDPAGPTIGDLAGYLLLRHHSVGGLVDRAEAAGMVRRERDADDHRALRVLLAHAGRAPVVRLAGLYL